MTIIKKIALIVSSAIDYELANK